MTFEEFVNAMHRPWYVWKMAKAALPNYRFLGDRVAPLTNVQKGAPKRMEQAQREIDDLVLKRAETIMAERAFAADVRMYPEPRA